MFELIQTYVQCGEMPLLCVVVFSLFLVHLFHIGGESEYSSSVKRVLLSAAVFAFVYALWDIVYFTEAWGRYGFYTINFVCNVSAYVMLCLFYKCSIYYFRDRTAMARFPLRVCHVLFAGVSAVYWLKIDSGLFITTSHTSPLDMGPLDILWYGVVYMPAVTLFVYSLYSFFDKRHFAEREDHSKVLLFTVILMVSAVFDQYMFEAHVLLMGLTAAMIVFYLQSISSYISLDDLTELYNRRQLLRDMEAKSQGSKKWGIIMMDLNGFKKINDTYGHDEGDAALQRFAGVL
ncbi:MAG: diguanylate cyclase [Abditibacteriota bacterium]|nr:diguanylate cyclase [Abditibacteriota bacterium]